MVDNKSTDQYGVVSEFGVQRQFFPRRLDAQYTPSHQSKLKAALATGRPRWSPARGSRTAPGSGWRALYRVFGHLSFKNAGAVIRQSSE